MRPKCGLYVYLHKCKNCHQPFFSALGNPFILCQADNPGSKLSSAKFRRTTAESLISLLPKRTNINALLPISDVTGWPRLFDHKSPIDNEDPK